MNTPTRSDYMTGKVTHQDYYLSVARSAYLSSPALMIRRARIALEAGDEHLNTIPLREWDIWSDSCSRQIGRALSLHGDTGYSLGGGVCALKALVRHAALQIDGPMHPEGNADEGSN